LQGHLDFSELGNTVLECELELDFGLFSHFAEVLGETQVFEDAFGENGLHVVVFQVCVDQVGFVFSKSPNLDRVLVMRIQHPLQILDSLRQNDRQGRPGHTTHFQRAILLVLEAEGVSVDSESAGVGDVIAELVRALGFTHDLLVVFRHEKKLGERDSDLHNFIIDHLVFGPEFKFNFICSDQNHSANLCVVPSHADLRMRSRQRRVPGVRRIEAVCDQVVLRVVSLEHEAVGGLGVRRVDDSGDGESEGFLLDVVKKFDLVKRRHVAAALVRLKANVKEALDANVVEGDSRGQSHHQVPARHIGSRQKYFNGRHGYLANCFLVDGHIFNLNFGGNRVLDAETCADGVDDFASGGSRLDGERVSLFHRAGVLDADDLNLDARGRI